MQRGQSGSHYQRRLVQTVNTLALNPARSMLQASSATCALRVLLISRTIRCSTTQMVCMYAACNGTSVVLCQPHRWLAAASAVRGRTPPEYKRRPPLGIRTRMSVTRVQVQRLHAMIRYSMFTGMVGWWDGGVTSPLHTVAQARRSRWTRIVYT